MEKRIIELYRRKFDDIRHEADGIEYWYARELMKLLDYVQWRNFDNAINKAMISCENNGNVAEDHFQELTIQLNGNIAKAGRKDKKTRYYYYCKNTVNATGHKCTFRCNIEQSQIDDVLAKLITAMTREGKFKDAIQDRIGATVDTSDLEKQLSVLNANLHQAETIKIRLEQQMDNLDITDIHYDKKFQIYRDD